MVKYRKTVEALVSKYDDLMAESARLLEMERKSYLRHGGELCICTLTRRQDLEDAAFAALEEAGDFICKVEGISHG